MNSEIPEDPQRQCMRERLEGILARTDRARAWADAALPLRPLINRDGYVPVKTRLRLDDLDLLMGARRELLCFSELGLRLLDLHQPRDAGGITSDAAHPILRCRSCMWRWPCPTFRAMSEALDALQAVEPAFEYAQEPASGDESPEAGEFTWTSPFTTVGEPAGTIGPVAPAATSETAAGGAAGNGTPVAHGTSGNSTSGNGTSGNGISGNGISGNGISGNGAVASRPTGIRGAMDARGLFGANGAAAAVPGSSLDLSGYRFVGDRQPDVETAARAFIDNGDRAFVSFDDAARDREAEARAPIGARGPRGFSSKGHFEDPW
jgi:hypothetical protein